MSEQATEPSGLRLALTLGIAGLLSGIVIVSAYELTLPRVEANKARALREAVFAVLPGTTSMRELVYAGGGLQTTEGAGGDAETIFAGYGQDGELVGYAIEAEGPGFQDTIRLLYGYRPRGQRIVGMHILESRETPGLGDKIYKDLDFVANFAELAVDPPIRAVKKGTKSAANEIDAITGATISSVAVAKIINAANEQWLPRLGADSANL